MNLALGDAALDVYSVDLGYANRRLSGPLLSQGTASWGLGLKELRQSHFIGLEGIGAEDVLIFQPSFPGLYDSRRSAAPWTGRTARRVLFAAPERMRDPWTSNTVHDMAAETQPLYADQLRTIVTTFAPGRRGDRESIRQVLRILLANAEANDNTDKKLDWYSIALLRVLAHNLLPGLKESMPVDPGVVAEFEKRFAEDFPVLYRPRLVERQFNWVFENATLNLEATDREMLPVLVLDLLARVGIASYLLEVACEEHGQDYEDELDTYLSLAAVLLQDFQRQGMFLTSWELPPTP